MLWGAFFRFFVIFLFTSVLSAYDFAKAQELVVREDAFGGPFMQYPQGRLYADAFDGSWSRVSNETLEALQVTIIDASTETEVTLAIQRLASMLRYQRFTETFECSESLTARLTSILLSKTSEDLVHDILKIISYSKKLPLELMPRIVGLLAQPVYSRYIPEPDIFEKLLKMIAHPETEEYLLNAFFNVKLPQSGERVIECLSFFSSKKSSERIIEWLRSGEGSSQKKSNAELFLLKHSDLAVEDFVFENLENTDLNLRFLLVSVLFNSENPVYRKAADAFLDHIIEKLLVLDLYTINYIRTERSLLSQAGGVYWRELLNRSIMAVLDSSNSEEGRHSVFLQVLDSYLHNPYISKSDQVKLLRSFVPKHIAAGNETFGRYCHDYVREYISDSRFSSEYFFLCNAFIPALNDKEARPLALAYAHSADQQESQYVDLKAGVIYEALLSGGVRLENLAHEIFVHRLNDERVDEVLKQLLYDNETELVIDLIKERRSLSSFSAQYISRLFSDQKMPIRSALYYSSKNWGASAIQVLPDFLKYYENDDQDEELQKIAVEKIILDNSLVDVFNLLDEKQEARMFELVSLSESSLNSDLIAYAIQQLPGEIKDEEKIGSLLNYLTKKSGRLKEAQWLQLREKIDLVFDVHVGPKTDEPLMLLIRKMQEAKPEWKHELEPLFNEIRSAY